MERRNVAIVAAALSAGFGIAGLIIPVPLAQLFGLQPDATGAALIRLLSASYVAIAGLNWAARDLDGPAWRSIAIANAIGWSLSAVVTAAALVSGLGTVSTWIVVALQIPMSAVWLGAFARSRWPRTAARPLGPHGPTLMVRRLIDR